MKIVHHDIFYQGGYGSSGDGGALEGRMKIIVEELRANRFDFVNAQPANIDDIRKSHSAELIKKAQADPNLYNMALMAAGAAIRASEIAMGQTPSFACIRPPGHHAGPTNNWGFCTFNNMAIAIRRLLDLGQIKKAFILDIDEHVGDGTMKILGGRDDCIIYNPIGNSRETLLADIEKYLKALPPVDIIGICAGFDTYHLDVGKKLHTRDYYTIAWNIKLLCRRMRHNKRFAILEGGYYLPDLGKNVAAFCQGFDI